ncbi:MAG: glycosyltransferase family 2 protein [Hyphomicrobiaceae bacterium]
MPSAPPSPRPLKRLLSVVVPMLNEARGVDAFLARLIPALEGIEMDYEVIVVDDGSTDQTFERAREAHDRNPRIKALALSRNFGKEIAVTAGLRHAAGEAVVVMDGDLQHPPELIADLVARWREGYDVVYAQRADRNTDSASRRAMARIFYRTFRTLSGTRLHEGAGDFRLLSRRAVDAMNRIGERARFNKGLFAWIGFRSIGVVYHVAERADASPSRWRVRRLWHFALDGLASFTTIPLRIWSYVGLAISLLAFVSGMGIIIKTLAYGEPVAGYPTLIVSILFLGGIQLISLGVIGEYLGRVYEEVKDRPLYLVGDTIGFDTEPAADGTATK